VARAKRTERAEARRRYRNYLQTLDSGFEEPAEEETPPAKGARPVRQPAPAQPRPGQSVGMGQAFRLASRQPTYRDDLRYLPTLVLRTNAVWVPGAISLAGLVYALTRTDYNDGSIQLLLGAVLATPPLVQPMVAGFLAPRATWLAGAISGVITAVCLEIVVVYWFGPTRHLANVPASTVVVDGGNILGLTAQLLLAGVAFGALLGAASGWYKRFLGYLGAGGRNQRPAQKPASKRAARR
jgi:hypothetical protein